MAMGQNLHFVGSTFKNSPAAYGRWIKTVDIIIFGGYQPSAK
jgi:hypothetical protein